MTNATPSETRDTRTYLTGFVLALILTAIPFAQVGAWLAHRLPGHALRLAFAVLLLVTGVRMVLG